MGIPVRPRSGPINTHFVAAFVFGAAAAWSYPAASDWWQWWVISGLCAFAALGASVSAISGVVLDYRLRRGLAISRQPSRDHGTARQATAAEVSSRGMNDPTQGDLLGLDDDGQPVFAPFWMPFKLFEAAPGVGKTVCWVIGIILHRAMMGFSLLIPDVKAELAYILAPTLRKLGFEVWVINPSHRNLDVIGDVEINLFQSVVDAAFADGDQRKDAVKYAADAAALFNPIQGGEKQPYFIYGARRATLTRLLSTALINPAHCTPTDVYQGMADPQRFLKGLKYVSERLETHIKDDPIVATLRAEARNLLHRANHNEENFASFLEGATQRMLSFAPAGHLGFYGRGATHNISAIRDRQIIVFIVTPLSHLREFEPFISLLNENILAACKAKPNGHPVHVVGEEALSYNFSSLTSDLETLRQLKVTGDFFIQSFPGLVKRQGREAADAIQSYCDVRVIAGASGERAKYVSGLLAEATIRKQDYSYQADLKEFGISSREMGRRIQTADEIMAMPKNKAWAFIRGMRPVCLTMVHYGQIGPWCDWVGESPISGTRLPSEPLFKIQYPERDHA